MVRIEPDSYTVIYTEMYYTNIPDSGESGARLLFQDPLKEFKLEKID